MTYRCKYCGWIGTRKDFEIDHEIPVSRSPLLNFLQPRLALICSGCNRQKRVMTSQEYANWRFFNSGEANFGPVKQEVRG